MDVAGKTAIVVGLGQSGVSAAELLLARGAHVVATDAAARERLTELLREAAIPPKTRRATRPTRASKEKRLEGKTKRARIKRARRVTGDE